MQLEIQVALNFVISFMYNKLPRRRVNIFGEELEKALRYKFQSHWYPERPCRGSGFRCLRTGDPVDPVLDMAARESGLALAEIRENLPADLSVWIDPGEVSYRIGEKGQVKMLYSEQLERQQELSCDTEVRRVLHPDPRSTPTATDELAAAVSSLVLTPPLSGSPYQQQSSSGSPAGPYPAVSPSSAGCFQHHRIGQQPLTFTTAAFAQTKFGSTKLKSSAKRSSRMSPTEFSNYIKQRAVQQHQLYQPRPPSPPIMPPGYPPLYDPLLMPPADPMMPTAPLPPVTAGPVAPSSQPPQLQLSAELLETLQYSNPHLHHLLVAN